MNDYTQTDIDIVSNFADDYYSQTFNGIQFKQVNRA